MALKSRDVVIAATCAFIAWGLATGWVPTLRYLGYAFTTGFCFALLSITALIFLSSRNTQDYDSIRERTPRTAVLIDAATWENDRAWLARRDSYKPTSLYPSSYIISNALDSILEWLFRDLITSWYSSITRNPNFVHEVDRAVRAALINVRNRLLPLDVVEVVVSRFVPIVTDHLKEFYEAERAIRGKNLNRNVTESEELDLAIAGKYRDGNLHPAASLAYSDPKIVQQEHLREIVARLLPEILPENLIRSRVVSVLLREILACAVMAPLMQLLSDPDIWNQLMEVYVRAMDPFHMMPCAESVRDELCSKIGRRCESYGML
jgi:sorting nexin-25